MNHKDFSIAWILPSDNPSFGGPPRVAKALVLYFSSLSINSVVITDFPLLRSLKRCLKKGLRVGLCEFLTYLRKYLSIYLESTHVIFSGVWSFRIIFLFVFSAVFGKKIYIRTSGMLMPFYLRGMSIYHVIFLKLFIVPLLRTESIVKIANSEREKRFLSIFSPNNLIFIENPSENNLFLDLSPQLIESRFSSKSILFYSRIAPVKGLDKAIRSIACLKLYIPNVSLVVVGPISDISYYNYCLDLVEQLDLSQSVEFRQPVYTLDAKISLFRSISCALFPSLAEGFPNSLVECISSGLPVIATKDTNIPFSVLSCIGKLITQDPLNISNCILPLLSCYGEYNRYSQAALKMAKSRYSIQSIGDKYISYF